MFRTDAERLTASFKIEEPRICREIQASIGREFLAPRISSHLEKSFRNKFLDERSKIQGLAPDRLPGWLDEHNGSVDKNVERSLR
jgi:hypothetical protein